MAQGEIRTWRLLWPLMIRLCHGLWRNDLRLWGLGVTGGRVSTKPSWKQAGSKTSYAWQEGKKERKAQEAWRACWLGLSHDHRSSAGWRLKLMSDLVLSALSHSPTSFLLSRVFVGQASLTEDPIGQKHCQHMPRNTSPLQKGWRCW